MQIAMQEVYYVPCLILASVGYYEERIHISEIIIFWNLSINGIMKLFWLTAGKNVRYKNTTIYVVRLLKTRL